MKHSTRPQLSVIVPAYQGVTVLPRSLAALRASDLPRERWELIVVDDGSTDGTASLAGRYADRVVRVAGGPHGPAHARNRGVEVARSELLVFLDADVCVHPDTLRRFVELFAREPQLGAAFGAYDTAPPAPGVVSQYRNLLHRYVHVQNQGEAETFWAGCGAVRRDAFLRAGGFDHEAYPRPQVEDIELGYRLRDLGYRILLDPAIQVTHLKRWTLTTMITTDLLDRGIPWMRLLIRDARYMRRSTLNVRLEEKVCTGLVGLALALSAAALVLQTAAWLWGALLALLAVLALNAALFRWFMRERGAVFGLLVVPLRLLYYLLSGMAVVASWAERVFVPQPAASRAPALDRARTPEL